MGAVFDALQLFSAELYFQQLLVFATDADFLEPNSQPLHPNQFIPTLDSRLVCVSCLHVPTNHSHTSPVDKAIHSTAQKVPGAHIGNKQRQAQKDKGQRKMNEDFYFPWNDKLFCRYRISYKCTSFRLLANIIYVFFNNGI